MLASPGCIDFSDKDAVAVEPEVSRDKPLVNPNVVTIMAGQQTFEFREFLSRYRDNPNFAGDEVFVRDYTITAVVADVPLFDPNRKLLESFGSDREIPAYRIPLMDGDPAIAPDREPSINIAVWFNNFSREKATALRVGERITAICSQMAVSGGWSLRFENCRLIAGEEVE